MTMYDSSLTRLELFKTQNELARNFYDDFEFCPVLCMDEVSEHRERIQQRGSPHSSPNTSPPYSSRRIPIIDPENGIPVSFPSPSSSSSSSCYQQQHHHWPALSSNSSKKSSLNASAAAYSYRAIPVVDPTTGQVVPAAHHHPQQHQEFNAFHGLSVR
ncbi:hypothetical protein O0I10_008425 [Lichtheimia ornata]|uniref:Uncharacterized protein n=1 Tax=Lichtheimia ornata TaxID=688661 RepID=A0AAD7XVI0_9FUNG|nr:uncharacterized protein O0I10_008425 [Lichtheimia ornata]KAJ8655985.1 hypothetical protein O0I10_008425 [Lichtheimia ornata]